MSTSTSLRSRGRRLSLPWPARGDLVVRCAAGVLGVIVIVAVLAPLIAPHDPDQSNLADAYLGSSGAHPLGTDSLGRDLLSRVIWGARPALAGPALVVLLAGVVGATLAVVGAWFGGWCDRVVNAVFNTLFAFPAVLFAILSAAIFGAGLKTAIVAIAIAYVPYVGRVVRSEALRQRQLPYVAALEAQGHASGVIVLRHLVPNLLGLIVAQMTASFGYAMVDIAAMSFLGLGIQPPNADWGEMVSAGQIGIMSGHASESLSAGAMLVIVVIAVTTLGDRLVSDRTAVRS